MAQIFGDPNAGKNTVQQRAGISVAPKAPTRMQEQTAERARLLARGDQKHRQQVRNGHGMGMNPGPRPS